MRALRHRRADSCVHDVDGARFLTVVSIAIEELPVVIKKDVEDYLEKHPRSPAAQLRPRMGMVDDVWLAFIGPKLRPGAAAWDRRLTTRWKISTGTSWNHSFLETVLNRIRRGFAG